ncbi:DUF4932 domain-containing protein [Pedobacter sp. P26]|uniref:DUF4932 domain-containing protein n=1 Tax=Pedobacter sp. P26 TaxID=3423956 RepID=UPI003D66BD2B
MNKKLIFLSIISILLNACSITKNLKSTQTGHEWKATYDNFNATEKLKFSAQKDAVVYLSSKINSDKGTLDLILNNQKLADQHQVNHYRINLDKGAAISISGKNATGSFSLSYPVYKKKDIRIIYKKNIELLALSYLLANYEDFTDFSNKPPIFKDLYALTSKIAFEFKPFLNSKNLNLIKTYLDRDFYLHYSNFILSLDDFPNAKVTSVTDITHFKSKEDAERFVTAFNDFFMEVNFQDFLTRYTPYYKKMTEEVALNLPKENFISEMENYFGKSVPEYILYPSLTLPFSSGFAVGDKNTIGNIFASFNQPGEINDVAKLNLGYSNALSLRTICIHEFGHSFVNPAVDLADQNIIQAKAFLFDPIKDKMTQEGYNQWKICLYEHVNRANEVIMARHLGDEAKANDILKDNIENRTFIYLPQVIEKLEFWYDNEFLDKTYEQKVSEIISELR